MTVVQSNYAPVANDLFETPAWVTRALLRHFPFAGRHVWEPAAGNHKMADALRTAGAFVFTSDVFTYSRRHDEIFDFLSGDLATRSPYDIVSNPPYGPRNRDAARFARRALQCSGNFVALLLTAKFDCGSSRIDLFSHCPRFAAKITLLDRIQWFEGNHENTEDHAWFVWRSGAGAPRLIWERNDELARRKR